MRNWFNLNRQLVAFIILAVVGGFAIKGSSDSSADKLYDTQIESCQRGNILREENNRRTHSHEVERDAFISFLGTAQQARVAAYDRDHNESDRVAAQSYRELAQMVKSQVIFKPVSLVDCDKVIVKP